MKKFIRTGMNTKQKTQEISITGTGLCDICGSIGRLQTCALCGRRICERCYIIDKGVCRICVAGRHYK